MNEYQLSPCRPLAGLLASLNLSTATQRVLARAACDVSSIPQFADAGWELQRRLEDLQVIPKTLLSRWMLRTLLASLTKSVRRLQVCACLQAERQQHVHGWTNAAVVLMLTILAACLGFDLVHLAIISYEQQLQPQKADPAWSATPDMLQLCAAQSVQVACETPSASEGRAACRALTPCAALCCSPRQMQRSRCQQQRSVRGRRCLQRSLAWRRCRSRKPGAVSFHP